MLCYGRRVVERWSTFFLNLTIRFILSRVLQLNESDRGGYFTHQVEDESKNIEYAVVNNQTIRHLFLICTIILLF
jgi:hypothetical protein